jgi:hypothetical protein
VKALIRPKGHLALSGQKAETDPDLEKSFRSAFALAPND